jgi:hypothetical protein
MSMSSKRVRQQNRAALITPAASMLAIISVVAIMLASLIAAGGCQSRASKIGSAPPDRSKTVETAAAGVGQSAQAIDEARADATAKAPEVQPESDRIGTETARLRQYQRDLEIAVGDLRATRKHVDELTKGIADRDSEASKKDAQIASLTKQLDEIRTSGIRKMLLALAAASVVGVVISIWLLKSIQIAAVCATGFAVSVGGTYLLAYANWLAIGVGAILLGSIGWAAWRLMQSHGELVRTAEVFKSLPPESKADMSRVADTIQSEFTKRIVAPIREKAKKTAAGLSAFASK